MAYLNKVMLIGNIGKDPEISANPQNGRKRVNFSLATSRKYRDNNGEQKEQTEWHNIVGWGKLVDIVENLGLKKGIQLYVEGRLTSRTWTDSDGAKRHVTEIDLESFQVLTPRSNGVAGQGNLHAQNNPYAPQNQPSYNDGEDLPF